MSAILVSEVRAVDERTGPGRRIVARFNLSFGQAIFVNGCCLLHREDKGWTVWGPSLNVQFTRRARQHIKLAVLGELGLEAPRQMAQHGR